ncbi:T9SS type A sorting domain-containing protein [bacterium]|nr:T9SS type A sorting domain-containing protein [bacterium]
MKYPTHLNLDNCASVSHPCVLLANNKYHLWYVNNNNISYAKSTDGVIWEEYPSNPVLTDGGDGDWDGDFVSQPSVVYDGALYRMWFTGYDGSNLRIGYATSTDGVVWNKYTAGPVLDLGVSDSWDGNGVSGAAVVSDGTVYRMWYTGYDGSNMRVGYATSTDGVVWNKHTAGPVLDLGVSDSLDDTGVSGAAVVFDGTVYHMCYTGYDGNNMRIGYATSTDGVAWHKDESNPVLNLGATDFWDNAGVMSPSVLYDGILYRMWYTGYDGSKMKIGYAIGERPSPAYLNSQVEWVKYPANLNLGTDTSHPSVLFNGDKYHAWYVTDNGINYAKSTDGVVWEEYPSNPVLTDGSDGEWDRDFVSQPSVVYDGALYRMWFTGYDGSNMKIGYATSTDGVDWHKHTINSVLDLGINGSWDDAGVSGPSVLYFDGLYRMWFTGYDGSNMRIGYATSTDGMDWNKYGTNSVLNLGANDDWDYVGVSSPSVLWDGILYHLFYTGYDGDKMRVGYATSTDGVVWHKDESNPVLNLGANDYWDDAVVSAPNIIYDGKLYRMFYTGYDGSNLRIGYAMAQVPLPNPLLANAGTDVNIYPGTGTILNGLATGGTPPYNYSWSPITGLTQPNIANPIASPSTTTIYTLTVTDSNDWTAQDEVVVTVSTAATIFIQPATNSLTADKSVAFTCMARDGNGNTWTVTNQTTFTTNDPAGTITANVYQPGKAGTWTITAIYSGLVATATVNVTYGTATALFIQPATNSLTADESVAFTCMARDGNGNTWTVTAQTTFTTDDLGGTITANVYQPGKAGTWTITAIYSGLVATATVNVTYGTSTALFIQPATNSLTTDKSVAFTCMARDGNGNTWTVTNQTTFTTDDPAGTMTANVYQPGKVGTWIITAVYGKTMATATITVFLNSQQGGTVTDKGVTIGFDPGVLGTANVTVNIATATQISQPLLGEIQCIGIVYNITLHDELGHEVGTQTGQIGTVAVYLAYLDVDNNGVADGIQVKEKDLIVYQWEHGTWTALTTFVDGTKDVACAYVSHFSTFTLGGIPTPIHKNNLINVFVYPNPCSHTSVTFVNLTAQATIRIFNIAGEEVATFEENDGDGKYIWQNPQLASGIYIYLIMNNRDEKITGKIGIIK